MNIGNLLTPATMSDDDILSYETLYKRIAIELGDLATVCANVEDALGQMLTNPNEVMDQPIMTLQGLDRIRQSLQDMSRLATLLQNAQQAVQTAHISASSVREHIILTDLADRLTQSESSTTSKIETEQEIFW